MKCLCWHLTKGSCPEPNEVLDTKVRSMSAVLAPTVGYTMVLSRLYLAPKSWSVALRLKYNLKELQVPELPEQANQNSIF